MAELKELKELKEVKFKAPAKGTVMFIPNAKAKQFSRKEPKNKEKALLIKLETGKGVIVSEEDGKAMQANGFGKIKVAK